jgi:hypothetical protein
LPTALGPSRQTTGAGLVCVFAFTVSTSGRC